MRQVGPQEQAVDALDIDGSINLYHPEKDVALVLNGTASDIWQLCDGRHDLEGIIRLLAASYRVDASRIRHEVEALVAVLVEQGFLTGR